MNIWLSITRRTAASISSRIVWYCALRSRAGTATDFGETLIGDHSFDASGGNEGAFTHPAMCVISFPGDIGRRTLVPGTNRVNGGCERGDWENREGRGSHRPVARRKPLDRRMMGLGDVVLISLVLQLSSRLNSG